MAPLAPKPAIFEASYHQSPPFPQIQFNPLSPESALPNRPQEVLIESQCGLEILRPTKPLTSEPPMAQIRASATSRLRCDQNLVRTSIYDKYLVSMQISTHLDHISNFKTASGTNWSNRWTY